MVWHENYTPKKLLRIAEKEPQTANVVITLITHVILDSLEFAKRGALVPYWQ